MKEEVEIDIIGTVFKNHQFYILTLLLEKRFKRSELGLCSPFMMASEVF